MGKARYVLGFAFNGNRVVLIRKCHGPTSVLGKLNGLGGKVRDDESSIDAMTREFKEESGVYASMAQWRKYCTFYGYWGAVECFSALLTDRQYDNLMLGSQSVTDERVETHVIDDRGSISRSDLAPGLLWLIPMALDHRIYPESRVRIE